VCKNGYFAQCRIIDLEKQSGVINHFQLEKKIINSLVAVFLLIILSPLILLLLIIVKLDSRGSVWLRLERAAKVDNCFYIYKIRTMEPGTHKITRAGKFLRQTGLDEMPQLINVIKAEMSLVGPRPEVPEIVKNYSQYQKQRLSVLPGITGLWQISDYRREPIHNHLEFDLEYIKKKSCFYDLSLIAKTLIWAWNNFIFKNGSRNRDN